MRFIFIYILCLLHYYSWKCWEYPNLNDFAIHDAIHICRIYTIPRVALLISNVFEMVTMRPNDVLSGALLQIFFNECASCLSRGDAWPNVVEHGVQKIMLHGGASVGMKTLLDAVVPFSKALNAGKGLKAAAAAARAGAESTKGLYVVGPLVIFMLITWAAFQPPIHLEEIGLLNNFVFLLQYSSLVCHWDDILLANITHSYFTR